MSLSEVSNILWRERRLLELLVFKLEEEQLMLASGRSHTLSIRSIICSTAARSNGLTPLSIRISASS